MRVQPLPVSRPLIPAAEAGASDQAPISQRMLPRVLLAGILATIPGHAFAQIAGNVALSSSLVFRGETVSDNDPALTLAFSLDDKSGFFAGGSVSLAAGDKDPRVAYHTEYAGYALRKGETSFELGAMQRGYHHVVDTAYRTDFVEGFVGVTHRGIRARVYVSPNYLQDSRTSYYGEVNMRLLSSGPWSVEGHAGLSLIPNADDPANVYTAAYYDWQLQVNRPIGKVFVSAGVAATNYPVYSSSGNARVFATVGYVF